MSDDQRGEPPISDTPISELSYQRITSATNKRLRTGRRAQREKLTVAKKKERPTTKGMRKESCHPKERIETLASTFARHGQKNW